jgi:hypothetical protein
VNQKEKNLKPTALHIFGFLQVTVTLTVGIGRQRGRRHSRSPGFLEFPAVHAPPVAWRVGRHAATVPAVAEGLPCNFWSFRGCFVNFKLFNVIVI